MTDDERLEFSNLKNAELKEYLLTHACEGFLNVRPIIRGKGYKQASTREALLEVLDGEFFVKVGRSQFIGAAKTREHAMDILKRLRNFKKCKDLTLITTYSRYEDFKDFFEIVDL